MSEFPRSDNLPDDPSIPNPKPGWQTSEFWITGVTTLLPFVAMIFGLGQGEVQTLQQAIVTIITSVFALVTAGLVVWKFIASRIEVKNTTMQMRMQQNNMAMQLRMQAPTPMPTETMAMTAAPLLSPESEEDDLMGMATSIVLNAEAVPTAMAAAERIYARMRPASKTALQAIDPAIITTIAQLVVALFQACREQRIAATRERLQADKKGRFAGKLQTRLSRKLRKRYQNNSEELAGQMVAELRDAPDAEFEAVLASS